MVKLSIVVFGIVVEVMITCNLDKILTYHCLLVGFGIFWMNMFTNFMYHPDGENHLNRMNYHK